MKHIRFTPSQESPSEEAKKAVITSLRDYLERNTGPEGFFKTYHLLTALGGVAAASVIVAQVWKRHGEKLAEQAATNIADQAHIDGGRAVRVEVEIYEADEKAEDKTA